MKILLANPRGFCAGVEMAIRALELVVERVPGPIYVYHEIVHNQHVVQRFESQGVTFVDSVSEVPRGGTLVFSAHGVSPATREAARRRDLHCIDATCPLVAKVHAETVRFAHLGYQIILLGHAGHDEVVGTIGEAPHCTHLVANLADIQALDFAPETKLAYLMQTTLSVNDTARLVDALRDRFPHIEGPPSDDICYATQNRQTAVRDLVAEVDLLLVVGSNNSSNSHRLCEVAKELGVPSHLIDDATMLEPNWFSAQQTIGLTAGASAPESSVQSVLRWLSSRFAVEVEDRGTSEPSRVFALPVEVQTLAPR